MREGPGHLAGQRSMDFWSNTTHNRREVQLYRCYMSERQFFEGSESSI